MEESLPPEAAKTRRPQQLPTPHVLELRPGDLKRKSWSPNPLVEIEGQDTLKKKVGYPKSQRVGTEARTP